MRVFEVKLQPEPGGEPGLLQCWLLDMSPKIRWKARPAVILCPGGAYEFTNDRESEPVAAVFLAMGFQVFSLRYSVKRGSWPRALLELASAVKLVRSRAEEWDVDTQRVVIAGFSAGGHLAAEYCCKWNRQWLQERADAQAEQLRPDALVLGYPVITAGAHSHRKSIQNLLGDEAGPERLREVSLEHQAGSGVPPTVLWHTASDEMVPVENSLAFARALSAAGVPFELHVYPFGVHGLGLGSRCTVESDKHIDHYCYTWVEEAKRFLEHYLQLEG